MVGLDGNDIFGMVGGVICFVGVGVGDGVISFGSVGVSGNEKLIVGRAFGSGGTLGRAGLASGEGSVGVTMGAVLGTLGCEMGSGSAIFTLGMGGSTFVTGCFAGIGAASDPKIVRNEGVSGISKFRISERLNSCEIFSNVVEVIYPSSRLSFSIRSNRRMAARNAYETWAYSSSGSDFIFKEVSNLKSFVSSLDFLLKSFTTGIVRPKVFCYPFPKCLIILFFIILKTHPNIM